MVGNAVPKGKLPFAVVQFGLAKIAFGTETQ